MSRELTLQWLEDWRSEVRADAYDEFVREKLADTAWMGEVTHIEEVPLEDFEGQIETRYYFEHLGRHPDYPAYVKRGEFGASSLFPSALN